MTPLYAVIASSSVRHLYNKIIVLTGFVSRSAQKGSNGANRVVGRDGESEVFCIPYHLPVIILYLSVSSEEGRTN